MNGTVTATSIPLKWRSWTLAGADTCAGKTIRLLFHTANYNVPMDPTGKPLSIDDEAQVHLAALSPLYPLPAEPQSDPRAHQQ